MLNLQYTPCTTAAADPVSPQKRSRGPTRKLGPKIKLNVINIETPRLRMRYKVKFIPKIGEIENCKKSTIKHW